METVIQGWVNEQLKQGWKNKAAREKELYEITCYYFPINGTDDVCEMPINI